MACKQDRCLLWVETHCASTLGLHQAVQQVNMLTSLNLRLLSLEHRLVIN
jgi:hypothetical protein